MSDMTINIVCAVAFVLVSVVVIARRRIIEKRTKENKTKTKALWWIENGELRFGKPHYSVDPLPMDVPNGTIVHEEDTNDIYCFDAQEMSWVKLSS